MMVAPAVVEQQAKLGVTAEESKAQRLKRQQARFRDRGGAFVPSDSNPLLDILLARTVSGESPSKPPPKHVAKRSSPSKSRRSSPTRRANAPRETQATAGSSKSNAGSRNGKAKAVQPEVEADSKPPPKRRGRPPQSRKKALDPDSVAEQLPPAKTKTKHTVKGNAKQRAAPPTSDGHPKAKSKPRSKTKPAKEVVEVLDSDNDQTVDVPRRVKSKKIIPSDDNGESDDDTPIIKKRAVLRVDDSKPSGAETIPRVETNVAPDTRKSGKKTTRDEECPIIRARKRLVSLDEEDDELLAPPSKKGKASASTKPKSDIEPEPATCPARDVRSGESLKATGKKKGKGKTEPVQNAVEPVEIEDDERPPERVAKPKKRKKEEDNYDNRPRKVVKFSEPGPPNSLSHKLKENQPDKKHRRAAKPKVKDEPDAVQLELADKPPARVKTPKGPPREVLERIKASAARHLRCNASELDELDCLS